MHECHRDSMFASLWQTTEIIQKAGMESPRLGWRGQFFQERNFLHTYQHGTQDGTKLLKAEDRPHHGPLYWCMVYLLLSETGKIAPQYITNRLRLEYLISMLHVGVCAGFASGLSEFVQTRGGEPEPGGRYR